MIRILGLVMVLFSVGFCGAKIEHKRLNGVHLTLIKEVYREYDSRGETLKFYKEEDNGDLRYLHTLIWHDTTGSCSSKTMEDGAFEVKDDVLILYTAWDRSGPVEDEPYGARIQRVKVLDDGTFKVLSSKIYIEAHQKSKEDKSGMVYLFKEAKTTQDKVLLDRYVHQQEKRFKGKFLFDKEAEVLMQKVQDVLGKKKPSWGS